MFERINARRCDLGILAAVVIDVEPQTGIPALAGPISDEVNQWIDTAGGDVWIDGEVPLGIEIRIRVVSFEPASLQVMDQRMRVRGDVRVTLPIPYCIEQGGRDTYSELVDQRQAGGRRGERLPKPEDSSGGDWQTCRSCSGRPGRRVERGNKSARAPPEGVFPAADGDRVWEFLKESCPRFMLFAVSATFDPLDARQCQTAALFHQIFEVAPVQRVDRRFGDVRRCAGGVLGRIQMLEDHIRQKNPPGIAEQVDQVEDVMDVIVNPVAAILRTADAPGEFAKLAREDRKCAEAIAEDEIIDMG